jgi:maleate isomerase
MASLTEFNVEARDPNRLEAFEKSRRIGLLVFWTDIVTERDFQMILPAAEITTYVARVRNAESCTTENLAALGARLAEALAMLVPGERLDVIAFSCTSGTAVMGFERVAAEIGRERPGLPLATPLTAALAAFRKLATPRIAVLAPYSEAVTRTILRALEDDGIAIAGTKYLGIEEERAFPRLSCEAIIEAGVALAKSCEADALFIPCTAIRAAEVAATIEALIGMPVVTSNQAMIWQALRLVGDDRAIPGFGRLLTLP